MRKNIFVFFLILFVSLPASVLAQSRPVGERSTQPLASPAEARTSEQAPPDSATTLADFDAYVQRVMQEWKFLAPQSPSSKTAK